MNGDFSNLTLERLPQELWTLLIDPVSNLAAALTLYAIIATLLTILLIIAILFIMSTPEDATDELAGEYVGESERGATTAAAVTAVKTPRTPRSILVTAGAWFAVFAVTWIVTGYASSVSPVCEGCHVITPHTVAEEDRDPHVAVTCVACHESGGFLGRYVWDVPSRVLHVADGMVDQPLSDGYGIVSRSGCSSCHGRALREVTFNEERGLNMSHTEPLEASARCTDCHMLEDGIVGAHNAGMNPCLRCHDSQLASAECSTCHDRNASAAARPRTGSFTKVQVEKPTCGGCHDEAQYCDPCHGTRMPHTNEFMAYAHAREGAVDFWYNNGRTCAQCHTAERRSCQRCHGRLLGGGHGKALARGHWQADEAACNRCHQKWAFTPQRDFCVDVCHSPLALEHGVR